ncbi:MAG: hypothetical protein ACJAY8_000877 [Sphingobacteriales bacterium]|jgi:hypothetical protein
MQVHRTSLLLILGFFFGIQMSQAQVKSLIAHEGFCVDLNAFSYGKPLDGERFYQSYNWKFFPLNGGSVGYYFPWGYFHLAYSRQKTSGTGGPILFNNEQRSSSFFFEKASVGLSKSVLKRRNYLLYVPFLLTSSWGKLEARYVFPPYVNEDHSSEIHSWGLESGFGIMFGITHRISFVLESTFYFGRYVYRNYGKEPPLNPKWDVEIYPVSSFRLRYNIHSKRNPFGVKCKAPRWG